MNVMIIGSGGREHAVAKAVRKNHDVEKLYVLPGNGGTCEIAQNVAIAATDIPAIVEFAKSNGIDFAIVTPDDPLALGAVDALHAAGIKCFGPSRDAAIIESSKSFAKELMRNAGIPTADSRVFDDAAQAREYLKAAEYPIVIKADGLALGKGVVIAESFAEAASAVDSMMTGGKFGAAGRRVVIEEFLRGDEISCLTLTDGKTIIPLASSMDHKRALDGDLGLNTGGMGAVAPNPFFADAVAREAMEKIFLPTVEAMNKLGRTFRGCLYFGLMLTKDGLRVIEYNCRFGDPETQAVLPLLKTDLLTLMLACENGTLADMPVELSCGASCCLVLAAKGYPEAYEKGMAVTIDYDALPENVDVCHAGTRRDGLRTVTSGGRVMNVVATADTLGAAVRDAYKAAEHVRFEGQYMRTDIGARALARLAEVE